nr:16S rRNA (cytosine(1402)-N(4))-methyltransferase [Pseudomonadota bacterium]
MKTTVHTSVLLNEVIQALAPMDATEILMFDGTLGGAGHSLQMLENNPNLLLVACDKDPEALARAEVKLEKYKERFCLLQSNFAELEQIVNSLPKAFCELLSAKTKFPLFDRSLLDLGISSDQLDDDQRG